MKRIEDNIIRPKFGDPKVTLDRTSGGFCMHEYVVVIEQTREVYCRQCKREIDPFEIAKRAAWDWEQATHRRQELDDLSTKIEGLRKEEKRIKSRVRGAKSKSVQPESLELFFVQYLERLSNCQSKDELWETDRWRSAYNPFTAEQSRAIKDAQFEAQQRVERNDRAARRTKHVMVIEGGKP